MSQSRHFRHFCSKMQYLPRKATFFRRKPKHLLKKGRLFRGNFENSHPYLVEKIGKKPLLFRGNSSKSPLLRRTYTSPPNNECPPRGNHGQVISPYECRVNLVVPSISTLRRESEQYRLYLLTPEWRSSMNCISWVSQDIPSRKPC